MKTVIRIVVSGIIIIICARLLMDINSDWYMIIPWIGSVLINLLYMATDDMKD